tara:strand:- start:658 stop:807 length:150 start_codon:yes stop_codon:yes gene_type:complete
VAVVAVVMEFLGPAVALAREAVEATEEALEVVVLVLPDREIMVMEAPHG